MSAPRVACKVPVDEQWGEMNTPGIDQSGESGGTGSISWASRPAPAIQPCLRARNQRFSVRNAATGCNDEVRARLHRPELGLADHASGLIRDRGGDDNVVRSGKHVVEVIQAEYLVHEIARQSAPSHTQYRHVECLAFSGQVGAGIAESDYPDNLSVELAVIDRRPAPFFMRGQIVSGVLAPHEHEHHGPLGHRHAPVALAACVDGACLVQTGRHEVVHTGAPGVHPPEIAGPGDGFGGQADRCDDLQPLRFAIRVLRQSRTSRWCSRGRLR